jgi:hypothetical protein
MCPSDERHEQNHFGNGDIIGRDQYNNIEIHLPNKNTPSNKLLAYEMGLVLNKFEQIIKDVSNCSIENGKLEKFILAGEMFYQIRDDFLARGKAILINSEEINLAFIKLNTAYSVYGANLERFAFLEKNSPVKNFSNFSDFQKSEYMEEITKLAVSLTTELLNSVNKQVEILRFELKKNMV